MIKKEYLSFNEMTLIVNECSNISDFLERKFIKDMYLLRFATDLDIKDDVTSDDYDKYVQDGTIGEIYEHVKNISELDAAINDAFSVNHILDKAEKSLEKFLDNLNTTIDNTTKSLPKTSKGWETAFNKITEKLNKESLVSKYNAMINDDK